MSMMNSMSRMRGQEKGPGYTQTEAILGESMQKFGRELGEDSNFGEFVDREAVKHSPASRSIKSIHTQHSDRSIETQV